MSARLLPGVWAIAEAGTPPKPLRPHEMIADVEELVLGVLTEAVVKLREPLPPADFEEAMCALFERVIRLQRQYDPPSAGIEFRPFVFQRLRFATTDHFRSWCGRHGEKRVPDLRFTFRDFDPDTADHFRDPRASESAAAAVAGPADTVGDW